MVGDRRAFLNPTSLGEAISIYGIFPYMFYRTGLSEALRKRDPIDGVAMPVGVTLLCRHLVLTPRTL